MPYWIRGRDRNTGRMLEPFPSDAPSEMSARVDAIARGVIVESITAVEGAPDMQTVRPAAPTVVPRPGSRTPHAARYHDEDDPYGSYEVIIGSRGAMYYLRRFVDFDRAGRTRITWHWPAFFVAFFWLVYRKMWAWALGYLIAALIGGIAVGILAGLVARLSGAPAGSQAFDVIAAGAVIVYGAIALVGPALYANAIYHRHCRREMERARTMGSTERQRLAWLASRGGTDPVAMLALAAVIAACVAYIVLISQSG